MAGPVAAGPLLVLARRRRLRASRELPLRVTRTKGHHLLKATRPELNKIIIVIKIYDPTAGGCAVVFLPAGEQGFPTGGWVLAEKQKV